MSQKLLITGGPNIKEINLLGFEMTENQSRESETETTERAVKPSKPRTKRPTGGVFSAGFEEFSGKMLPLTLIILGLAIIFGSIAFLVSRDFIQYWFLFRNSLIIGFILINYISTPFLVSRIAVVCFAGAGIMLVVYGLAFYLAEQRDILQRYSKILGFLLGSVYLLLLAICGFQLSIVWLYDQVTFQIAYLGFLVDLGTGFWQYLLLIAAILLIVLTLVSWVIPNVPEEFRKIVFPLATVAVWLLAFADWTKATLVTSHISQFASVTLLPSSLFMGEPLIEGAALLALGLGMLLKLTIVDEKENIRFVFTAMAGLVYGIALFQRILLIWSFSTTVFWTVAIVLAVVAGVLIILNGVIYFRDCAKKI